MKGSLDEFQLPDVLQVVGVSRQHTLIELRGRDGKRRGVIVMKAGQVLAAESTSARGRDAFFELFQAAPDIFHVFRRPDASKYSRPLGSLTRLLFEAADQPPAPRPEPVPDTEPQRDSAPGPQPVPEPVPEPVKRGRSLAHTVKRQRKARSTSPRPVPSAQKRRRKVVVAVASPKGGVGKTTITLNLATSMAERGLDTILVDADINGDVLSLVDGRDKVQHGAFELLDRLDLVEPSLCRTACERLRILPACGPEIPVASLERADMAAAWARLVDRLEDLGDIVLIDCPAGMFHTTGSVLRSCSHVVGVFQAEIVSSRSFSMFMRGLAAVPAEQRPALAGVVANMFQGRADASIEAYHRLCDEGEEHRLFDTTIPRSEAFGRASLAGHPLRTAAEEPDPVAWLFDMLADEVCHRVGVRPDNDRPAPPKRFLQ